jgi:hypothetical protein
MTLLDEYWAWKRVGGVAYLDLEARALEAFVVLESEQMKEHHEQIQRHQPAAGRDRDLRSFGK